MSNKISCIQLFNFIPDELLVNLEQETKVNHQVKKLSGQILLKLLLFSLLNSNQASLRIMEEIYATDSFKALTGKGNQPIKHSGIAYRLSTAKAVFFEQIFYSLAHELTNQLTQTDNILKIDSTLVGLSSELLHWGMEKADKRYLKFTLGLKGALPTDVKIFSEQKEISEELTLKEAILTSKHLQNCIFVFDRGLQKRETLSTFTKQGIKFITRSKSRLNYKTVKELNQVKGQRTNSLILKQDLLVHLKDEKNHWTDKTFRLIIARSKSNGEELLFLTNIELLKAKIVTEIYKRRWEIEVFFKFLKQHLQFEHLVSRTENGVRVILYATLILALLLLAYKEWNHINSYKIAKFRFSEELNQEIIKEIVRYCGGDINRLFKFKSLYPS